MAASWEQLAEKKRQAIASLIPPEWRISRLPSNDEVPDVSGTYLHRHLSPEEIEITETDAVGIAAKTATGSWKAVDVARAFCHRAALAHQLLNCLHEIFFDDALEQAQKLDDHFSKTGKTIGPMHGVPVSLKDQFHVRGVETTMGYVGWIGTFQGQKNTGKEQQFESLMVQELRSLGAVLFCKTSVPHTLMSGETMNNIIGYCWNPRNRRLASGGSSGGEAALIGVRGSPLGFGTDIGGSVRIPAGFNGLFGLRPSTGRLPYEGMANSMDGQNSVLSVVGPLATTARSLRFATQAILSTEPWLHDPLVNEIPYRTEQEQQILSLAAGSSGRLSVGVLSHDRVITPHPPVSRALSILAETIRRLGHEVIDWKPPSHKDLFETGVRAYTFDSGVDVHQAFDLSGEPLAKQIKGFYGTKGVPKDAVHIAQVNREIRAVRKEHLEYWNSTATQTSTGRPVDAFIMPLAPFAAARPELYRYIGYSCVINFLDYTAVALPVTNVDKTIDKIPPSFEPLSDGDAQCQATYDPEIYDGAHVGVQLVGRKQQEEKMIALAEYLYDHLIR